MRGPVLVYLSVLAALPLAGLVTSTTFDLRQVHRSADAAQKVMAQSAYLREVDRLRVAIKEESVSALITAQTRSLGVTTDMVNAMAGFRMVQKVPVARAYTDRLFTTLRRPAEGRRLDEIRSRLTALRTLADGETAQPTTTGADDHVSRILDATTATALLVTTWEETLVSDIVTGSLGVDRRSLARSTADLGIAMNIVVYGGDLASSLSLVSLATTPEQRSIGVRRVRTSRIFFAGVTDDLDDRLTPSMATAWSELDRSPSSVRFSTMIDRIDRIDRGGPQPAGALTRAFDGARDAYAFQDLISGFLARAVDAVSLQAKQADASAATTFRLVLALVSGAVASTLLITLGVAGALRRRLGVLGEAADRLRSGRLDTSVTIRGPAEFEQLGRGLNDATHNLRQVLYTAELLAQGRVAHPEERGDGRLAAAVHGSLERLRASMIERDELHARLAHQAGHDGLTGLLNRSATEELLARALRESADRPGGVAVLFIDLDAFKAVNDGHGHAAGDLILQEAAARMASCLSPQDHLCRLGGDEFVVVMTGVTSAADPVTVAERIVSSVEHPFDWHGTPVRIGASVGLALNEPGELDADDVLIRADHAVYRAKAGGKGRVER